MDAEADDDTGDDDEPDHGDARIGFVFLEANLAKRTLTTLGC
jgi:hypothetical protein